VKRNGTFAQKCVAICLLAMMVALPMVTTGCGTSELQSSITVAEQVVESSGNILSASNPAAGALLLQSGGTLKELGSLVAQYDAAVAAGKPGIATQIQAVVGTLTANLTDVLATVHVKNPELVEYVTVAVAVANSVVTIILSHLPSGVKAQDTIVGQAAALPTVPFKSHKDLKAAWNNKVKTAFPQAVVK
jgi:hypothetical protein